MKAACLLVGLVVALAMDGCEGFGLSRRQLGVVVPGSICTTAPLAASAAATVKKYSADDAKKAIGEIREARKTLDGLDALLAKGDFDAAATALDARAVSAFEENATIIINAPVLAAEDKKAIGTIRRYGVAADVMIMTGGLKEALRDEDARGAKSYLSKAKGSLDEVISIAKGGGLR